MRLYLKDYVTLGNAFCGFLSIIMVLKGELFWACSLVMIGFVFDAFDGLVARLTNCFNRFGAELDNISDLITYSVAPSFIVYLALNQRIPEMVDYPLAREIVIVSVASLPLLFGVVRFARFIVNEMEYPGFWIGVPRPISAMIYISLIRSHLYASDFSPYLLAGVVILLSIMNLSFEPMINHHRNRSQWHTWLKGIIYYGSITLFISALAGYFWDVFCIYLILWSLLSAFNLGQSKKERAELSALIQKWKGQEEAVVRQ